MALVGSGVFVRDCVGGSQQPQGSPAECHKAFGREPNALYLKRVKGLVRGKLGGPYALCVHHFGHKDAGADLEGELDFGRGASGSVEPDILHAPALDSREAHTTTSTKPDSHKQDQRSDIASRATRLRRTL